MSNKLECPECGETEEVYIQFKGYGKVKPMKEKNNYYCEPHITPESIYCSMCDKDYDIPIEASINWS